MRQQYRIEPGQKEEILEQFQSFREYLSKRIHLAQKIGLNEEQLALAAEKVADYLDYNSGIHP